MLHRFAPLILDCDGRVPPTPIGGVCKSLAYETSDPDLLDQFL